MNDVMIDKTQLRKDIYSNKMLKTLLGDEKKANSFMATAYKTILSNPNINNCSLRSIINVIVGIAELGLSPNPKLGEAYITPLKLKTGETVATLIIGAKGYIKIMYRIDWKIKSYIVGKNDFFEWESNLFDEKVLFKKNLDKGSGEFKNAVAMAQSPKGDIFIQVMGKQEIEKHRMMSNTKNKNNPIPSGIWEQWYSEMALKTVVKKLVTKQLPIDLDGLFEKEEQIIEQKQSKNDETIDIEALINNDTNEQE